MTHTGLPHIVFSELAYLGEHKLLPLLTKILSPLGYRTVEWMSSPEQCLAALSQRDYPVLIPTSDGPDVFSKLLESEGVRFIHLRRDLRDVFVSLVRCWAESGTMPSHWDSFALLLENAVIPEMKAPVAKSLEWLRLDQVLQLCFEDLETDLEGQIRRVLQHAGITLELYEHAAEIRNAAEVRLQYVGHSGQYREHFDGLITKLFTLHFDTAQRALGYPLDPAPDRIYEKSSFFNRTQQPYYIYAPDYRQSSAGIRALHYLCHTLNEFGYEAYVALANVFSPKLRTPRLTPEIMEQHYLAGLQPIAVYPEVVSGNPLCVPGVARWLLNEPGHLGGDSSYAEDDLIYYYNDTFLPPTVRANRLNTPCIDFSIFNNQHNPHDQSRKGACYYANKYLAFGGQVDPEIKRNATSLCQDIPRTPEEIADILRRSEVLYCYEQSSIVMEALACGCPVFIVPSEYWRLHGNGTGQGLGACASADPDEFARARRELVGYTEILNQGLRYSLWQVERFAVETQATVLSRKELQRRAEQNPWHAAPEHRHIFLEDFRRLTQTQGRILAPSANTASSTHQEGGTALHSESTVLSLFSHRANQWPSAPVIHLIAVHDQGDYDQVTATLAQLSQQPYSQVILTVISNKPAPGQLEAGRLEWLTALDSPWPVINEALKQSPGDWCGVVRAGDQFSPLAFLSIAEFINAHPACSALYTDEAVLEANGTLTRHQLKPDFDEDLLISAGYVGGLLLAKKETWINAGGWRPLPRGLDEFDAAIRLTATAGTLGHLEGIHYLRHHSDPALHATGDGIDEKRLSVAQELLQIVLPQTNVEPGLAPGLLHARHPLPHTPGVSLVIPTRDNVQKLDKLISSILAETVYADYELLIVDNGSTDEMARAYLAGLAEIDPNKIRVIHFSGAFNLAAQLNQGAACSTKELLLFLHDDVAVIHKDWLTNLVTHILRPGVKAVGARLISSDSSSIVEAGISPSQAGILGRPFQGWPIDHPAPLGRVHAVQRVSAVSAACMLVTKADFLALGGMDAEHFPEKFADIDFCLKLREAGGNIVWTPYATLIHDTDNTTWGDKSDNNALLAKWGKALVQDPRNNPYIALGSDTFVPEAEPAFMPDPITWHPLPNVYSMSSDQDGAGHYRVIQPVQHATEQGLIRGRYGLGYPVPVMMEKLDIDLVFSQRQLEDRQLDNLTRFKKLLRCKIVMDFDDLLTNVPDKNVHKRTLLKDMKGRLRRVGELADRFTVSTEPLAREFKQFHDDIRVVPNALLRSQWAHLTSQRGTSRKLRVGWAGGVSHQGDLEVIRDVVRDLAGEVDWVFMGMCLKELNPHIKEFHAGAQFNAYPAELAKLNLDLAIAPLELNAFNECKSHLRVLEYGILGIPVIATNITPYQGGFPITLVKNKHQDWVKAIREYVNDPDETYKRGDALRQHILDNWMLEQHLETWRAAWEV